MSTPAEIAEKLRDAANSIEIDGTPAQVGLTADEHREAADALDSLQAQVEVMREALEPFAILAAQHLPVHYSFPMIEIVLPGQPAMYTSDWQRARAVIEGAALSPIKPSDADRREVKT